MCMHSLLQHGVSSSAVCSAAQAMQPARLVACFQLAESTTPTADAALDVALQTCVESQKIAAHYRCGLALTARLPVP